MSTETAEITITNTTYVQSNGSLAYDSQDGDVLHVKGPSSSGTAIENVSLLMLDIPTTTSLGIPDNSVIETIKIILNKTAGGTEDIDLWLLTTKFVEELATWRSEKNEGSSDVAVSWNPTLNGPATSILKRHLVTEANAAGTGDRNFVIPNNCITEEEITFGNSYPLGLYMSASTNTATEYKDDSEGSDFPVYQITYGQTKPNAPKVAISGSEDTSVTVTNESTYDENNSLAYLIWRKSNSTIAASGTRQATFTDTNWKTMNSADLAQISSEDFLQDEDTKYYLRAFHENLNNLTTEATGGNVVEVIRPKVNAVAINTAWSSTGTEGQLTVTGASSNHSGYFKKLYIIWDGASSGETYNSNNISTITLEDVANTVSKTHIYGATEAKYIWIGIEDANGLKSDLKLITTITGTLSAPNPTSSEAECVVSISKKTMPITKYGLFDDVNAMNMIRSTTGDSSLEIAHYSAQHAIAYSTAIFTAFATECNNVSLESGSKQLMTWQNNTNADTEITVFGIASFYDNNGTETKIADTAAEFNTLNGYYKYVSEAIDTGAEFVFSADSVGHNGLSDNFFKQVDMAVVTVVDSGEADADPTRYALVSSDFNWATHEPICRRLCVTKNNKAWSNYIEYDVAGANDIRVDKSNNKYTFIGAGGNWYFNRIGFFIGDKVYIKHSETTGLDGYYEITGIAGGTGSGPLKTGNEFTVTPSLAGSGTNDEKITIYMDTRQNAAIPFVAYGASASGSATFTTNVSQVPTTTPARASNVVVNYHVQEELNLDELMGLNHLALLSSNYNRAGGLDGKVPLGKQIYPIGTIRTNSGMPTLNLNFKILSQTGLRTIWNIIEGNRYDYCYIGTDRIDAPTTNHRTFVLKMVNGTVTKTTDDSKYYNATLSFMIIGEQR